jgi:hypothetical protein
MAVAAKVVVAWTMIEVDLEVVREIAPNEEPTSMRKEGAVLNEIDEQRVVRPPIVAADREKIDHTPRTVPPVPEPIIMPSPSHVKDLEIDRLATDRLPDEEHHPEGLFF